MEKLHDCPNCGFQFPCGHTKLEELTDIHRSILRYMQVTYAVDKKTGYSKRELWDHMHKTKVKLISTNGKPPRMPSMQGLSARLSELTEEKWQLLQYVKGPRRNQYIWFLTEKGKVWRE